MVKRVSKQSRIEKTLLRGVIGFIAGVVATGPMTVAMILWHRRLPHREQYPLPPREITMKLARKTGLEEHMSDEAKSAATLVAHFAYGAAAGAVYGALSERLPVPAVIKGVGCGLLVWTGSYLGLLPSTGILNLATDHPARRNLLMIGAHIVWGAALGMVTQILQQESGDEGQQPFSASYAPHYDVSRAR
jgi:putative membrane protein